MAFSILKISITLMIALCIKEGWTLDCYTYTVNSFDGVPDAAKAPLQQCTGNYSHCATLSWTTQIPDLGAVVFQQGLCTNWAVCQSFCSVLRRDSSLDTPQCQQQCCNSEACNTPRK